MGTGPLLQRLSGFIEQRAQQLGAVEGQLGRHGRQPRRTATPFQGQQQRFALVILMLGGKQRLSRQQRLGKGLIARLTRLAFNP